MNVAKVPPDNGLRPTADTPHVMYIQTRGAAGDAAHSEEAMKKRLSSIITPIYKIIPFIFVPYGLFWLIYDFRSASLGGAVFLFVWCAIWSALTFRWKSVYLEGDSLAVSNYLKRIEIPLSKVESVDASNWWGWQPRTVTIRLKSATEFGESIVFVPRLGGLEAGELADELRALIAARR